MKNYSFAAWCLVLLSFFAVSCATQQGVTQTINKPAVKGNWVMSDIRVEGLPDNTKVTIFDEAVYKCFIGSQWVLPDNGMGSYTLSSTTEGCSPATQNIIWSLNKQGGVTMFQFKKLYGGVKPKNVAEGYRVEVTGAGSIMTWKTNVGFEDKSGTITYTLQRR